MKIYIATDHTGFAFKQKLLPFLQEKGYEVEDCGAYAYNSDDDYPDFISKAAEAVSIDPENARGIVFGGSGQGEAIVANKFKGVRCTLFYAPVVAKEAVDIEGDKSTDPFEMLRLARTHNLSNMLSIGIRFVSEEDIFTAITVWLESPDTTQGRHVRRIEKINLIEKANCL